ncbi:MAG TPA: hypothetical protein V6C58_04555, partial [Allocoleopsis sp.]
KPENFEGWGIFQPLNNKIAELIEEPILPQIGTYLKLFPALKLRLINKLRGQTWLAYPCNESDMKQRFKIVKPIIVNLVTEGGSLAEIIARFDGGAWWFDELDRRGDLIFTEKLKKHLKKLTLPEELSLKGITPEMRTVYQILLKQTKEFQAKMQKEKDEIKLEKALKMGGGELREFRDKGDFWQIEWTTNDGQKQTSAISKNDLTVISSGICLSGKDRDFDLQSLVGVIEARDNY